MSILSAFWSLTTGLPWWLQIPVIVVVGGFLVALAAGVLRALYIVTEVGITAGHRFAMWSSERMANAAIRAGDLAAALLAAVWALALWPFTAAFSALRVQAVLLIDRLQTRWDADHDLRRQYKAEFREQFSSFAEFKRAFHEAQRQEEERKAPRRPASGSDAFADAVSLFDLPRDGSFTRAAFDAAYRAAMKAVHPDRTGLNGLAVQVNQAAQTIKMRKGWT